MFNRIGAVILLVSDMKESMKFYKDVLGMEVKQQTEDWVEFSKQGTVPTHVCLQVRFYMLHFFVTALHKHYLSLYCT
jgi:catechol 2,3-dioxygenase-like lactoylglutathione lyase family enzyme